MVFPEEPAAAPPSTPESIASGADASFPDSPP